MDFLEFIFGVVKEAKPLLQKTASDIQLKTDISDYSKRFFNEKIESMPADINVDFEAFSDYCIEKLPQIIAVIDGSIQAADRESMKGTIIKCAIKEARANSESSRKLVETYVEAIFTLVAAWEWKRIDPATRKILVEHESSIAKLSEGIEEAFDKQTSKLLNSLDKAQTQPFSNKYMFANNAPWFVDNHSAFKEYGLLVTFAQICEHFGQCEIASKMIVESAAKYIALEDKGSAKAYNIIETYPWSKLFSIMRIDEAYILLSDITEEWDKIGQLQCNQYLMPLCIELSFVILNAEKTVLEYHIQCLEKLSTAYTNYPLLSEFIDMLNDYIKPHNHATSWLERYHEKKAEFQETYGYLCYLFYAASPDSIPANAIIAFISVVRSLTTMYDPISDFFVCAHVVPFFNKFLVPTISRALGKDSRIAQSMKDMKENLFTLADTFGVKNSQEVEDWLLEY